jgi:hypothetical protein
VKKNLMTVVLVRDMFEGPFNSSTPTKPKRYKDARTIAQQWVDHPDIYPKTSQLNRYRKPDGSLADGKHKHRNTKDAAIEFSELHKYMTLRKKAGGSIDGLKTYQVFVDGDGVMLRDSNSRPLCDPPLDGLPFADDTQKPKRLKTQTKPVEIKIVALASKAKIKQVQAELHSKNQQIDELPARSSRSLWRRIKAVFVGGAS